MNGPSILPYLELRVLPTGRRIFVLQDIRSVAMALGMTKLVEEVDEAIAQARSCLRLEAQWNSGKVDTSEARGEAMVVDARIDKLVGEIHQVVAAFDSGEKDDPQAVSAAKLRKAVFPQGPGAVTTLTFEEQLGSLDTMLESFEGELAEDVTRLSLTSKVKKLRPLVDQFRAELEKKKPSTLSWDEVSAAQQEGQVRLGDVIVEILAANKARDPETVSRRTQLLSEYERQAQLVFEAQRRQRRVLDVHPDTGEELPPGEGEIKEADAA